MRSVLFVMAACLIILLCGCGSKVPETMKNPKTEFIKVEDYKRPEFVVPSNYRLIKNGIYAVLDENGNIEGYMKLVKDGEEYVWVKAVLKKPTSKKPPISEREVGGTFICNEGNSILCGELWRLFRKCIPCGSSDK